MSDGVKVLAIDLIILDAELQGREAIDADHVADLRAAWRDDPKSIPPLRVFFDGTTYWLSDGFHRWHAAKEENRGSIPCEVIQGTKREAWLDSLKVNQGHGLRRSNADKRKLVTSALNDVVVVSWSDSKIAEHIGVTHPFVSGIRKELVTVTSSPAAKAADNPRVGRDGKKRKAPKSSSKRKKRKKETVAGKGVSGGATFDAAELASESKDAFGSDVPPELAPAFELCEEFDSARDKLTAIKSWLTQRKDHPGAVLLMGADQRIRTDIDNADREIKFTKPYCVCVYCHNKVPASIDCNACKGLGWITEPVFKQAPEEKRATVKS